MSVPAGTRLVLLSGNEAIARGAFEAGGAVVVNAQEILPQAVTAPLITMPAFVRRPEDRR